MSFKKTLTLTYRVFFLSLMGILLCCQPSNDSQKTKTWQGRYIGQLSLNDTTQLPFVMRVSDDSIPSFTIENGPEEVVLMHHKKSGDTLELEFPLYNTFMKIWPSGGGSLAGMFQNRNAADYFLPMHFEKSDESRKTASRKAEIQLAPSYRVNFEPGTAKERPAIGEFHQNGEKLSGTFLTNTGDYRYLQGAVSGDSLYLFGFDGGFLHAFKGQLFDDTLSGIFYSGKSGFYPFKGWVDEDFQLDDPTSFTYLKDGYEHVEFSFPDVEGNIVTSNRETQKGNVTIVQLMGSWCPNCKDETRYLLEVLNRHKDEGLEVIGLTFERPESFKESARLARKMLEIMEITYPVLVAGQPNAESTQQALPMLNRVSSFPTAIFIDKNARVRYIHSGFAGPGTSAYADFVTHTNELISQMLSE